MTGPDLVDVVDEVQMLAILRGLPASGKTRHTRSWVRGNPRRRIRVNRDSRRTEYHGGWLGESWQEDAVSIGMQAEIGALLDAGYSVAVDDTNLNPDHVAVLEQIAAARGIAVDVWDLTSMPLKVCIDRDAARTGDAHVGEEVIRRMYARWLDGPAARGVANRDGWLTPRNITDLDEPTAQR